jgi:hypothetical protein
MYEIRPESIKTFVEDNSIKLPRFQRKQTWDDKKNFELCISIFKEYPMGVCILNVEKDPTGKTTKWLLDGRQRRNALMLIWEDPENIYIWAKKWIGFKTNDQIDVLELKFWEAINEYLEEDELDKPLSDDADNNSTIDDSESENSTDSDDYNLDQNHTNYNNRISGLEFLLEIIKLVHNKTNRNSGFSRPFDFTNEIRHLPYEENSQGKRQLNSKTLISFINEYLSFCKNKSLNEDEINSFKSFMKQRFSLSTIDEKGLMKTIDKNWKNIQDRLEILEKIKGLLISAKIGLIEVKDILITDAQKIFNIINSKGTILNAVEILSAKPSWNVIMENASAEQKIATQKLYNIINVKNENVVKWDLPASILLRFENADFFLKHFTASKSDFEKQLTIGFKFLAGVYQKGVKKEDVDKLSKNRDINWDLDIESFIRDINLFSKIILTYDYFKYLKSWKGSIMALLSDAISLNFLLLSYEDWKRKGCPVGTDKKAKMFQKNCYILLDKLIFEYVTKQWRGSSDSKIAQNIKTFPSEPDIYTSINEDKWSSLLKEINDTNSIETEKINQGLMTPILYHFYCTCNIQGPDTDETIEVDHIIPQSLFDTSSITDKTIQNSLFNLALLPKRENISKSNKKLVEIMNPWLKDQILKYAFIEEKDYRKYSDLTNLDELKAYRGLLIENKFIEARNKILIN